MVDELSSIFLLKSGIGDSDFLNTITDLLPNMILLSRLQQRLQGKDRISFDKVASKKDIESGY